MTWLTRVTVVSSLLLVPGAAAAQTTGAAVPVVVTGDRSITLGGQLFYDFTVTTAPQTKDADGNTISPSAFNVTRAAIDVGGHVSSRVSFRITPDIARETGTSSSLTGSL